MATAAEPIEQVKERIDLIANTKAREEVEAGATLIDVREPHEWDEAHLEGAIHVPQGELLDRIDEVCDRFEDAWTRYPPSNPSNRRTPNETGPELPKPMCHTDTAAGTCKSEDRPDKHWVGDTWELATPDHAETASVRDTMWLEADARFKKGWQ
jgi:hypothetical protein